MAPRSVGGDLMDRGLLDRVARRVLTMIGAARVTTFNDSGPVQKLQVKVNDLETIDNLMHLFQFGFSSGPPLGTDVAIVFIGGDRSNGVVVGSNHQASRPKNLAAGESMIYSQDGKQIYLTASGGIVVNAQGQDVVVNGATNVTINASDEVVMNTPILKVKGDILDNYETNERTMAGMREVSNLHTHKVVDVQPGGATIESNVPDQQQ
ncbi:TPA: phage baseplate assembly protein V [Burkholderia multivorans]|nr:phage baseplate assembly protein V [Burkholderia multivorans]MBU9394891.1 phage baseplate assembly protein V [Burkholderia multivorans]HDR9834525.1 phage baseplate assembly protein V [Burkholderia multivorans]HDR9840469.1 phage baseplate assembly protein V [Burkholderia multivorans]HDR9846472.1 phage baseplate assembly protein V [Burkholderia multivorans]